MVGWLEKKVILIKYLDNLERKVFPMTSKAAVWFPKTELGYEYIIFQDAWSGVCFYVYARSIEW